MGFGLEMTSSLVLSLMEHTASYTDSSPLRGDLHNYGTLLLSHLNLKQIAFALLACVYQIPRHEGMSPGVEERKVLHFCSSC